MNNAKYSISIPKPCHEDWNKMSPEEKGRFCGVCNKTVVDFTNKTSTEVDKIIDEKKNEKICGRFNTTQLAKPVTVTVPAYIRAQRYSMSRAFIIALFFVFGTALFSCTSNSGELVGKIEVTGDIDIQEQTINSQTLTGDTLICIMPPPTTVDTGEVEMRLQGEIEIPEQIYALGGPRFIPIEETYPVKGEVAAKIDTVEKVELMGKPSIIPQEIDSVEKPTIKSPVVLQIPQVKGIDSSVTENNNPDIRVVLTDPGNSKLFAFPNPTSGLVTLKYTVSKQEHISIDVCTLKGSTVMKLVDIPSHHTGEYNTAFDLSDLANGIYLIRYSSSKGNETVRVVVSK